MKTKNNNQIVSKRNKSILIITIAMLVFLLVLKDIFQYEITSYDNWAYSVFVENLRNNTMTSIMKIITLFGSFIVICSLIVILYLIIKEKKLIIILTINTSIIVMINDFVKFIIHRPRPMGYNLINESNYSFPSGHSMVSTFFYGFLIYLVYRYIKNKLLKIFLIILLSFLIVLICISRIYLGVHYLSDTIAGFSLSLAYIMALLMLCKDLRKES